MDITHQGQQLIFYFDVFVEIVLYIFHCLFHIVELVLLQAFIYFMCLIRILCIYV